jgi:hypothetical protein
MSGLEYFRYRTAKACEQWGSNAIFISQNRGKFQSLVGPTVNLDRAIFRIDDPVFVDAVLCIQLALGDPIARNILASR